MKGGKYIPPNRKRLADDLLDKGEARETESLKDVLTRLARQKKSGSIVLDGRKSISNVEGIGKIKRFAGTIATMRVMGKVIMNHAAIRHGY